MIYIYKDHMSGGLYTSDELLDDEYLDCEQCGDSDMYIGAYESIEEYIKERLHYVTNDCIDIFLMNGKESIEETINGYKITIERADE